MATIPKQHKLLPACHNPAPALAAGLDEAGRGCLAGPVVAAAVILPPYFVLPNLTDSKKLSAHKREELLPLIKKQAIAWSIGIIWPRRIDKINILAASLEAMAKAACQLKTLPATLLLDGNQLISTEVLKRYWPGSSSAPLPSQRPIVGGDALIPDISAASIIAKTFRDRLMTVFARHYPAYGFERHKGYGTREHLQVLEHLGPTPIHRMTFRGVNLAHSPLTSLRQQELC